MNVKALVAGVALTTSFGAQAALETGTNGEAVFSAWDPVRQVSFTKDLGVRFNDLLAQVDNGSFSQTFVVGALYNQVFGTSSPANILWNVSVASTADRKMLFTSKETPAATGMNKNTFSTVLEKHNQYAQAINGVDNAPGDIEVAGTADNGGYAGSEFIWGESWGSQGTMDNSATLSEEMKFILAGQRGRSYAQILNTAAFAVNFDGEKLTFGSAVPVPAAVWFFGSALAGLAGVARNRKNA